MAKLVVFKVGDQPWDNGYKDGMPIEVLPEDFKLSDHMKKCFAIVKVEDDVAEKIQNEMLVPVEADDKSTLAPVSQCVVLDDLAVSCGDKTLSDQWRSADVVDVKVSAIKETDFKPVEVKDPGADPLVGELVGGASLGGVIHPDRNLVTAGVYTVGTAGSYSSWVTAAADTGNLTGNLTFQQISDISAGSNAVFAPNLNGFTLLLTSNSPPNGDPTAGWKTYTTFSAGQRTIQFSPATITGGGIFEIRYLNMKRTSPQNNDPSRGPLFIDTNQVCTIKIHDLMADWEGAGGGQFNVGRFMRFNCANATGQLWNIVATNFRPRSTDNNGGNGIVVLACGASTVIENCSMYTMKSMFELNTVLTVRNCCGALARNNTGTPASVFVATTLATGRNNAADDTSCANANWSAGSGNLVNQTFATEFVSLDRTNAAFFQLLNTATFRGLGQTPAIAGNTQGNRGTARPSPQGKTSIGADQNNTPVPVTGKPFNLSERRPPRGFSSDLIG
jgi:hypothetical protein